MSEPIYSMLTGKGTGFIWSGFSGETDYFGNPFPPVTFTVAGTADGVNYYTGSTSAQTGPESYMISTIYYYLYRRTNDPEYFPEGGGDWQIREDNMVNYGPPASYIFWTGTPSSTPPLSGWSNGSLQSS